MRLSDQGTLRILGTRYQKCFLEILGRVSSKLLGEGSRGQSLPKYYLKTRRLSRAGVQRVKPSLKQDLQGSKKKGFVFPFRRGVDISCLIISNYGAVHLRGMVSHLIGKDKTI